MMKLTLALLAVGATATRTTQDESCYGEWIWEECSWSYYQVDYCSDDCGWWYADEADDDWSDDYWVSCDEFDTWDWCNDDADCLGEWVWEDCSWSYYAEDNCSDDCGWWYWDDLAQEEYWVTCDDFAEWDWCWE